jgi:hypothetical protein
MGAIHESNAIFLTIANGKISRKVLQPTDISVERVNKQGKTVHEEFYKAWKGRITDVKVKEHPEYGKFWNVTLTDENGDAVLQMNYSSGYSAAFLKTLPNVDLDSDVTITPKLTIEGDKKKTSLFVSQHGEALKWAYTRENPNGLPELEKKKLKGKMVFDDSEIMEFLERMVNTKILPKLKNFKAVSADVEEEDDKEEAPF